MKVTKLPAHGNGQHIPEHRQVRHADPRTGIPNLGLVTELVGLRLTDTATSTTEHVDNRVTSSVVVVVVDTFWVMPEVLIVLGQGGRLDVI